MDHDPGKADRNAISALLDCFFDPGNTNSSLSELAKCQSKESAQHNIRAKIKPRAVDADHCVEPSLNSTNAVHQPLNQFISSLIKDIKHLVSRVQKFRNGRRLPNTWRY